MIDYIPLTTAAARKQTTRELRDLASERMQSLGYAFTATEFSPAGSGVRFDVIGIASVTRQVRIYEVKSSRADFLADAKWERYLEYCTHFAFVAPAGAIARFELAPGVGLVEYGAPALARMLRARRFGMTILREDCLRATIPSRRLRASVADAPWLALVEAVAFAHRPTREPRTFEAGAGI